MAKLPNAKDWRNRPIETWNALSFTEYLRERHTELYGIPYVPGRGGWRVEQALIKRMITEYGADVVRRFIDGCFREYKPSAQWPGLTFTFAYTYMRDRVLMRVLAEKKREEACVKADELLNSGMTADELADWL